MAFMTSKIFVFENAKVLLNLAHFLFFVLLPILINERSLTTLLALEEGSVEHNLRGKIWL